MDVAWLLKEKYDGQKTEGFLADCKRLKAGEPLAYIIDSIPFLNCTIYLDSKPLIPRTETEFWTEQAILDIKHSLITEPHVLDLCAGSGCIGVAVGKAIPEAHITFGEIDGAHLPTIAKNLSKNDIACTRYQVFQSNLFENITGTFDYILTNPPYIDPVIDRAEASVKTHEPHLALYGGNGGLELIETILEKTPSYLSPQGKLFLEHEPEQVDTLIQLARQSGLTSQTHNDQYGAPRYSTFTVAQ